MIKPEDEEKIKQVVSDFLENPNSPEKNQIITDLIREYPDNKALVENLVLILGKDERAISIALNNPSFLSLKLFVKESL